MVPFDLFTGEEGSANLSKVIALTIIIFAPPLCQTVWLTLLKFRHPIIIDVGYDGNEKRFIHKALRCFNRTIRSCFGVERMKKGEGGYKWEDTMKKFEDAFCKLKQNSPNDWKNMKTWIKKMEKINVNQYQDKDKEEAKDGTRMDGRATKMRDCKKELEEILEKVENNTIPVHGKSTNMMKIINHHVTITNTIDIMKQLNVGMKVSPRTDPNRKGSMEWRGVINEVTKLEPGLKFPDALRYSQIRKLSDNIDEKWDHGKDGTELDPHSLIIDPWGPLEKNANGFINAFLIDTWIYFFQLYFATVVVGVLFA